MGWRVNIDWWSQRHKEGPEDTCKQSDWSAKETITKRGLKSSRTAWDNHPNLHIFLATKAGQA